MFDRETFVVRVAEDAMAPRVRVGNYVWVNPDEPAADGRPVAVRDPARGGEDRRPVGDQFEGSWPVDPPIIRLPTSFRRSGSRCRCSLDEPRLDGQSLRGERHPARPDEVAALSFPSRSPLSNANEQPLFNQPVDHVPPPRARFPHPPSRRVWQTCSH